MASFVPKKVEAGLVRNFAILLQQTRDEEPKWKTAPHMQCAKINGVAISYWDGKGTLRLQGPRAKTQELNRQFIELRNDCTEPSEQPCELNNATPNTAAMTDATHRDTSSATATIPGNTHMKIYALMKFIAEWEINRMKTGAHNGNGQTNVYTDHQEEMRKACDEMRERRAINESKNELIEYIQVELPL